MKKAKELKIGDKVYSTVVHKTKPHAPKIFKSKDFLDTIRFDIDFYNYGALAHIFFLKDENVSTCGRWATTKEAAIDKIKENIDNLKELIVKYQNNTYK